jgi:putative ABC transport system substrate-binding protein
MVGGGLDPVGAGFVQSLARPGGNITVLTNLGTELSGKRLELLKAAVPKLARVAVFYNAAIPGNVLQLKEIQSTAPGLKLSVQALEVRNEDGFATSLR